MAKIFLPGQSVSFSEEEVYWPPQLSGVMTGKVIGAGRNPQGRGADSQRDVFAVPDAQPTDIIEIELDDGLKIWQSVESAETDFQGAASRSAADQALLLPRQLSFPGQGAQARGIGEHFVRAIRVLRGDPVGKAGKLSALTLARKIESKIKPGFYRCQRSVVDGLGIIDLTAAKAGEVPADEKILILLHGTFSSTQGSFGELAAAPAHEVWQLLEAAYPGGIYALQHRSVTESPVKNATDLIDALPKNARISLMSHSRGGMIAELISRASRQDVAKAGAIDDMDLAIFQNAKNRAAQLRELKALRGALADKTPGVNRVVRVAGPLAGTTLASERLDRYLSVALNVFELIPILRRTGAADLLKSFMLAFIRTKADPNTLPGLEAMMPSSPLTRMLNRPDVFYDNGLRVIGGDTEGSGILRRLGVLAADLFFRADHDFVVDTASMSRGGLRTSPAKPFLVKGPEVSHFSYFFNPTSRREIIGAAIEDDGSFLVVPQSRGVVTGGLPDSEKFPDLTARAGSDDPVCFVLPGVMGSHLSQDRDWIWTNPFRMAFGGLDRIRIDQDKVTASDMIGSYYWDIARFLSRSHKVIPFDYDWRLSILEQGHSAAARKLGKLVEDELNRTNRPIRFLAHSMGGLVVRALFHARPDLWNRIKLRPGSRFVMLGTPNGGSFSMMRTLLGRDSAIRKLELVDVKHDMPQLLGIVSGMHGALQLLPSQDSGRYLTEQFWDQLHTLHGVDWVKPVAAALQVARDGHKVLAAQQLDPELTCYVAGLGTSNTPSSVRLDPTAQGADRIKFFATPQGDGTVTWQSGIPQGIPTWYVDAIHGDMPRSKDAFPAYLDLLETGTTVRLSQQAPQISRSGTEGETECIDTPIELYPDQQEILDDFMGASRPAHALAPEITKRTRVSVVHGNLRFATYPVAVGHYVDDPMMGAEAALDQCLDHHLSKVRDLGLYPGKIETCEVILREDRSPQGAIVVGLGRYGSLSPGELKTTFRQAVLRYGLVTHQRLKEQSTPTTSIPPLGLSTLLIGHQGTNITVQQSVEAILQAVAEANQVLGDTPIEHLQFVELFDDTAFQAASALDNVRSIGRMGKMFSFDGDLRRIQGAAIRARYGRQNDWWQRIIVERKDAGAEALKYVAITENARAEHQISVVQPRVLQHLLTQRRDGTTTDREIGKLLFELLVPLELKSFAKENQKILLVLDKHAASYPWELMEDDFNTYDFTGAKSTVPHGPGSQAEPLVVRAPVIRQLITSGPKIPRANATNALIVGDPVSHLAPLDGAKNEADTVSGLLRHSGWETEHLDRPVNGFDVIKEIMLKPTKLIHLAGHGTFESDKGDKTGMVLGKDLYLTVSEIKLMRYVPEFVFLNCCHLGHVGTEVSEIASSLSVAFIEKGVRAVIAAGWEVDDAAASLFAKTFYTAMLAGNTFGNAVHQARIQVFQNHSRTNTWGAYQCYGDPDYRFRDAAAETGGMSDPTRYYSVQQATKAALNILESAASSRASRGSLLAQLAGIEASSNESWKADSEWCAAMGKAYAHIDAFDLAIQYLQLSLAQPDANGSLGTIQLVHDLRVRHASRDWQTSATAAARKAAAERVGDAVQHALSCYEKLDDLADGTLTPTRESRKGAVLKRLAVTKTGAARKAALKDMTDRYASAMRLSFAIDPDRIDLNAGINWLIGNIVGGAPEIDGVSISVWLDRLAEDSRVQDRARPGFWTGIVRPQTDVLRGLHDPQKATDATLADIRNGLDMTWRRGGSFRQAQVLRDQIAFIKMMQDGIDSERAEWLNRIERFVLDLTDEFQP